MEITKKEFEDLIIEILTVLPEKFKDRLENVDFVIEEGLRETDSDKMTLGLYEGIPYNRRGRGLRIMPDKITIYKKAIEKISRERADIKKNLQKVIHHEIGHYFGFNEKKLRELGY